MAKKTFNLILRVSGDWKNELQKICKNKGRTMTGHIEHSLKLAKLVTEFCAGNDDLDHVEYILFKTKLSPGGKQQNLPDIKPTFLMAAEGEKSLKLPPEKKVAYKKEKK
jgi:hypothetical protein